MVQQSVLCEAVQFDPYRVDVSGSLELKAIRAAYRKRFSSLAVILDIIQTIAASRSTILGVQNAIYKPLKVSTHPHYMQP